MTKYILSLCLIALIGIGNISAHADDLENNADLFTQLEGSWVIHTWFSESDGGRREKDAWMTITRMESEQAPVFMFEETHNTIAGDLFISRLIYAYHAQSNVWRGTGINTLANRKWRDVSVVDNQIQFLESGELFGGQEGKKRFVYFNVTGDRFESRTEESLDGMSWKDAGYGYTAERVKN